jgi:hypothetical protein
MRHPFMISVPLVLAMVAAGCTHDTPTGIAVNADVASLPFVTPQGATSCNGGYGQLSARPFSVPDRIPQLERVVVYGSPVQRPYRGYGDISTYGGVTNVYTYDRDVLDECSFGTDRTFEVVGPVDPPVGPDSLPMREGVDTALWRQLTDAERRSLDKLAELLTPSSLADLVMRGFRVARTFNKLADLYIKAQTDAPFERLPTQLLKGSRTNDSNLELDQRLRLDAFTIGCNLMGSYGHEWSDWPGNELADHARQTMSAWAARQGSLWGDRQLANQLALLGSFGVDVGGSNIDCGSAARNHFEQRFRDLIPSGSGGGDQGNQL